MDQIEQHGLLLSEYEPGQRPEKHHFPKRNRIINAWSQKILVLEAGLHSGSLITADYAHQNGREVFAAPDRLYSIESAGCNQLILNGATLYLNKEQLLPKSQSTNISAAGQQPSGEKTKVSLSIVEQQVLHLLMKQSPLSVSHIASSLMIKQNQLLELLLMLELNDLVRVRGEWVRLLRA